MRGRISDLHIALEETLPAPSELHAELRAGEAAHIATSRGAVQEIIRRRDARLLVVTGPCSIHETELALEYAGRLREFAPRVTDALFLVMRVYFEKPRTRLGWKGLIYDPDLDGRGNIRQGLYDARRLLLDCARLGIPAGSEILHLVTPQYYAELLAWGAIGARTTESPLHRQMASALSAPVGFKNPTSGNIQTAVDAILAAAQPHKFPSISLDGRAIIVTTTGNPHCHLVLRGSRGGPNHDAASVREAAATLENRPVAAPHDRLQPRQQRQRSPPPTRRLRGRGRPHRGGFAPHLRRHARKPPCRGTTRHPTGSPGIALWPERDRRLHGVGSHNACTGGAGRSRPAA